MRLPSTASSKMLRAGVVDPLAGADALPSALGGDDETSGIGREGFGDQFFGDIGAVGVGGVDEVDSKFNGATQGGDGGSMIGGRSPDAFAGDAHGAIAEAVDCEIAERDGSGGSGGDDDSTLRHG